jgi:dolichol-phosphate mannosyltransferase
MITNEAVANGISVVTTTWNEQENIQELIRRVNTTLKDVAHEIIVVDDSSTDGTFEIAQRFADLAISKVREGQTKGLLSGAQLAKYPVIVTIDADLENNPDVILQLVEKLGALDVVVASRAFLPRISERLAAKTLGKIFGVTDFYSNFRAYKREAMVNFSLSGGETFGSELLVLAKKNGFKIGEVLYEPPPRRSKPRIGGAVRANFRITVVSLKCFFMYL